MISKLSIDFRFENWVLVLNKIKLALFRAIRIDLKIIHVANPRGFANMLDYLVMYYSIPRLLSISANLVKRLLKRHKLCKVYEPDPVSHPLRSLVLISCLHYLIVLLIFLWRHDSNIIPVPEKTKTSWNDFKVFVFCFYLDSHFSDLILLHLSDCCKYHCLAIIMITLWVLVFLPVTFS